MNRLLLISRFADRLRKNARDEPGFEAELPDMAADEQIQAELSRIEQDFAVIEMDGLSAC